MIKKSRDYVEVDDIFEALDLEDAAELRTQTLLGVEVCKRSRAMKETQKEIAARLGITLRGRGLGRKSRRSGDDLSRL